MKYILIFTFIVIAGVIGYVFYSQLNSNQVDTISRNGIHWHPELEIYVKGEKVEIPQDVGLGVVHNPIHTHEDLPIIHLEFDGVVRKDDITLKQFFKVWGKDLSSFGDLSQMTVNDIGNEMLGEYVMQDGDKIKLVFE